MGGSDWTGIVAGTEEMLEAYITPPDLNDCRLYYTQIDEREASVTLGFETSTLPSNPPAEWTGREYNTVEFYLRFAGVSDLSVAGWTFSARDADVTLSAHGGDGVRVSIEATGSHLEFTASTSSLARLRSYLAARG
ncbi:Imm50 family immunity protein [Streptomyces sp. NPDC016309]|uniref:Imm50 family immunity protein n=1 Tax=Streptomyces sp. NPDC016309 TaxID=3364965 RepID=UPI003702246F